MRIADLRPADPEKGYPGQRFRRGEEEPYQYGRLIRVGTGSAIVRYETTKTKTITVRRGREVVKTATFPAPLRPVAISLDTEVTPIEHTEVVNAVYDADQTRRPVVPGDPAPTAG
jgi:hypothetical protein